MRTVVKYRWCISLLLALATLTLYWPVRHFAFVNYDDNLYVYENPLVQRGLTGAGLRWAFTTGHTSNWHPLTWLSLMADAEWHGTDAGGFHLTNLLLHTANSVLLFLVLATMTATTWRSAWVAVVFALHPLHVESVAWVAERKDVLSGLFWLLTMGAYLRYVRTKRGTWYGWTVLCLTLGLLAKPMLVTLPFVLLLLDWWPLRRRPAESWWRLVQEKLPLVLLAIASSAITFLVQQQAKTSFGVLPLSARLANAVVAYATYLQKSLWPTGLACFYPHPKQWAVLTVVAAGLVLAWVTALAVWRRRQTPALGVGWCWYLGTLVPVIGLVQVGGQAYADRYMYLPLVGLGVALAWGVHDAVSRHPAGRWALATAGAVTIAGCALVSWRQVPVWRDGITLFSHAVAATTNNQLAHYNLGRALAEAGRRTAAIAQYRAAVQINPADAEAHNNLGMALAESGALAEGIAHLEAALRLRPDLVTAHNNLGCARLSGGQFAAAIGDFQRVLQLQPEFIEAQFNLGVALLQTGRAAEAVPCFERVVRAKPDAAVAHYQLALAFQQTGRGPAADASARRARALAQATGLEALAAEITVRFDLHHTGPAAGPGSISRP